MVRCMCHDLFRMSVICQVQIPVISDVSFQLLCFPQPAKSAETHCPSHIGCLAATVVFPLENSSQLCGSCPLHVILPPNRHSSEFSSRVAEPLSSSPSFKLSSGSSVTSRHVTFWRPWEDPYKVKEKTAAHLVTPQGRVFRRARKRRSAGDLDRRRQRQTTFQANQTTTSSTYYPEPEQRLEVFLVK